MPTRVHVTAARDIVRNTLVSHAVVDAPNRLSKAGAQGAHVEGLQRALAHLGFEPGKPDGVFDAKTKAALKAFQATLPDLADSGIYGPKTRTALKLALRRKAARSGPQLRQGYRGEAVQRLEAKLKARGLFAGKADGTFDAATARAVKRLERQKGWKQDGIVGGRIWKELGGAAAGSGPTLRRGAEGLAVKALQRRLKAVGLYAGKVDGVFGAGTAKAVKAFEKREGVKVDGIAGEGIWRRLKAHVVTRTRVGGPRLARGYRGAAVLRLERKLKAKGLLEGKADGVFDEKTQQAARRFERRNGMKVDGVVTNAFWERLGGAGLGSGPRLKVGAKGEQVKVLQRRLRAAGLYKGPIDGDFGPMTRGAVRSFERRKGLKADGVAGNEVWAAFHRHVVTQRVASTWKTIKAPAHDYRRVSRNGEWMNVRTRTMLRRAEKYARAMGVTGTPFYIVQGSYSGSVAASGGTHDRGGALDIRTRGRSRAQVVKMVKALRMAGFAAWKRGYGDDSFSPHIHAIAIGDRQLSSSARSQVQQYFAGGDGLIGSLPDGDRDEAGRPMPDWVKRLR